MCPLSLSCAESYCRLGALAVIFVTRGSKSIPIMDLFGDPGPDQDRRSPHRFAFFVHAEVRRFPWTSVSLVTSLVQTTRAHFWQGRLRALAITKSRSASTRGLGSAEEAFEPRLAKWAAALPAKEARPWRM